MPLPPVYWRFQSWDQMSLAAQLWGNLGAFFSLHRHTRRDQDVMRDRVEATRVNAQKLYKYQLQRGQRMKRYNARYYTKVHRAVCVVHRPMTAWAPTVELQADDRGRRVH